MTGGNQAKQTKKGPLSSAPIETTENVARRPTRGTTRHPPAPPVGRREPKKGKMVSAAPLRRAGKASGTPADAPSTPQPKRSGGRNKVEETGREEETQTTPNTRARAAAAANEQEVVRTTEPQQEIRRKQTVGSQHVQQGQRKNLIPSPAASLPKKKRTFASKHDYDDDDDDDVDYVDYRDDDRSIDSDDDDDNNDEFGDDDGDKKMPAVAKRRGTADNIQRMNDGAGRSAKKKARISLNENDHVSHGHQLLKAGREFVLDAIIKEEVYPRTKFPDTAGLSFSNDVESICQFMAKKLKIADNNVEVWWRSTQKHVHQSLTKLRNNSIKGIKNKFEGKKAT